MRLRLFLTMSVALAAVVGLTVLVHDQLDVGGDGGDQIVSGPGTVPAGTDGDVLVPGPGQVQVPGAVTAVLIADAVLDPREVPTPLAITSERGFGNGGEVTTVKVDGESSTIVWDGGRPFSLSSGGALLLDPVDLALTPAGLQAVLGRGNHALTPGTYQLDTPVAVGHEGIATPRDAVTFEAVEGTLFEARGDASVVFGPDAPRRFVGPGKVLLGGTFEVTDAGGTHAETALQTGTAAFDLTFTPDGAGGWTVDGIVDQATAP
ncbi:MAG: hypothetical protein ACRDZU_15915 [Acidimicrobiales bacterium]